MNRPWTVEHYQDGQWTTWSTFVNENRASARCNQLNADGYTARIICPHCEEPHPAPYDGNCLI